jgi:hypothetical protein
VEVTADGAGLRVEPLAGDALEERGGLLVIPAGGAEIDDELVRSLRDAGQRFPHIAALAAGRDGSLRRA